MEERYCSHCGKPLIDGAQFCPFCGCERRIVGNPGAGLRADDAMRTDAAQNANRTRQGDGEPRKGTGEESGSAGGTPEKKGGSGKMPKAAVVIIALLLAVIVILLLKIMGQDHQTESVDTTLSSDDGSFGNDADDDADDNEQDDDVDDKGQDEDTDDKGQDEDADNGQSDDADDGSDDEAQGSADSQSTGSLTISFDGDKKVYESEYYSIAVDTDLTGEYIIEVDLPNSGNDLDTYALNFYHTDSMEPNGGFVFGIRLCTPDHDYTYMNEYEITGELVTGGTWPIYYTVVLVYPTDVQYTSDTEAGYREILDEVDDIMDTFTATDGGTWTEY